MINKFICSKCKKTATRQEIRSNAQNRLMYLWFNYLYKNTGMDISECRGLYKKEILPTIMSENGKHQETLEIWFEVKKQFNDYDILIKLADKLLHTSDLNTKEFTEFLNQIDMMNGGALPKPDDIYQRAMGRF